MKCPEPIRRGAHRECPECNSIYIKRRSDQVYCGAACNRKAGDRELKRGRVIYRALYWWRFDRKTARMDLAFICREIRHWIDEDKAAGRGAPPRHNHSADRGHLRPPRKQAIGL